jgi:hypothetical protein
VTQHPDTFQTSVTCPSLLHSSKDANIRDANWPFLVKLGVNFRLFLATPSTYISIPFLQQYQHVNFWDGDSRNTKPIRYEVLFCPRPAPPKLRPAGHIRPSKVFYVARFAVIDKSIDYFVSRHLETITTFIIKVLSALTNAPRRCEYDLSTLQTQFCREIQLSLLSVFEWIRAVLFELKK